MLCFGKNFDDEIRGKKNEIRDDDLLSGTKPSISDMITIKVGRFGYAET